MRVASFSSASAPSASGSPINPTKPHIASLSHCQNYPKISGLGIPYAPVKCDIFLNGARSQISLNGLQRVKVRTLRLRKQLNMVKRKIIVNLNFVFGANSGFRQSNLFFSLTRPISVSISRETTSLPQGIQPRVSMAGGDLTTDPRSQSEDRHRGLSLRVMGIDGTLRNAPTAQRRCPYE